MIVRKGVVPERSRKVTDLVERAVRKVMASKVGCTTCQKARRLVGRNVLKAMGKN